MSHQSQIDFVGGVRERFPEFFLGGRVLEVGSLNINGSVRDFFSSPEEYVGCDLGEGEGVDIVCAGHELPHADGYFDVAISCECFEHDRHWRKTFSSMSVHSVTRSTLASKRSSTLVVEWIASRSVSALVESKYDSANTNALSGYPAGRFFLPKK